MDTLAGQYCTIVMDTKVLHGSCLVTGGSSHARCHRVCANRSMQHPMQTHNSDASKDKFTMLRWVATP